MATEPRVPAAFEARLGRRVAETGGCADGDEERPRCRRSPAVAGRGPGPRRQEPAVTYEELFARNLGVFTADQQERLRRGTRPSNALCPAFPRLYFPNTLNALMNGPG
jgi:hypothetical protein